MNTYILIFKFFLVAHSAATIDHFTARVLGPVPMDQNSMTLLNRLQRELQPAGFVVRAAPPGVPEAASPIGAAQVGAGLYQLWLRYGDDEAAHMDEPLPAFNCGVMDTQHHEYASLPEVDVTCHRS